MRDFILMGSPVAMFVYFTLHPEEFAMVARFLEGLLR
jgi:hypothetical protein